MSDIALSLTMSVWLGEIPPCLSHAVHKVFGVTVGNVEADVADFRDCLGYQLHLLNVFLSRPTTQCQVLCVCECVCVCVCVFTFRAAGF